jgi:hypothetical protein
LFYNLFLTKIVINHGSHVTIATKKSSIADRGLFTCGLGNRIVLSQNYLKPKYSFHQNQLPLGYYYVPPATNNKKASI